MLQQHHSTHRAGADFAEEAINSLPYSILQLAMISRIAALNLLHAGVALSAQAWVYESSACKI